MIEMLNPHFPIMSNIFSVDTNRISLHGIEFIFPTVPKTFVPD